MKNLLYKEFKLTISPLFYILSLLGALLLIPNWLYFVALMYVLFITIPNIFISSKAQKDIGFSVMMPVRKKDVVGARVIAILAIELLHILVAAVFAVINAKLYPGGSFLLEPNVAFFGFAFVMFAVFNIIFFPMFYKTAYKIAAPIIIGIIAALIFVSSLELLNLFVPSVSSYISGFKETYRQLPVLVGGIVIFVLSAVLTNKISAKRFEKVDI